MMKGVENAKLQGGKVEKTYICELGNCLETDCPVVVSFKDRTSGFTKRFCSFYHASDWLRKRVESLRDCKDKIPETPPLRRIVYVQSQGGHVVLWPCCGHLVRVRKSGKPKRAIRCWTCLEERDFRVDAVLAEQRRSARCGRNL